MSLRNMRCPSPERLTLQEASLQVSDRILINHDRYYHFY